MNSTTEWGIVREKKVFPIPNSKGKTLAELVCFDLVSLEQFRPEGSYPVETLEILSPAEPPCAIVCQGLNYSDHIHETGGQTSDQPSNLFFMKAPSSLAPPVGELVKPLEVRLLDYELELGVVIGRNQKIAGWVMANDITARDIQIPEEQWFRGKSFRGFCPLGPYVYLPGPADWEKLDGLRLRLWVNGELRQDAYVRQMIHSIKKTMNDLSAFMDLHPGDLVLTGTPSGVAMRLPGGLLPKLARAFLSPTRLRRLLIQSQERTGRFLKAGDQVEAKISTEDGSIDLGTQRLTIK